MICDTGVEVSGEMLEASKARQIYTDIVSRTHDPALLEYIGYNLLRVKVFPVPPSGDQKIKLSYTSLASADNGLIDPAMNWFRTSFDLSQRLGRVFADKDHLSHQRPLVRKIPSRCPRDSRTWRRNRRDSARMRSLT